jgi:hypothetical protein
VIARAVACISRTPAAGLVAAVGSVAFTLVGELSPADGPDCDHVGNDITQCHRQPASQGRAALADTLVAAVASAVLFGGAAIAYSPRRAIRCVTPTTTATSAGI